MKYNLLGNTGLKVSELCLGTMTFGSPGGRFGAINGVDQAGADALLKRSLDAGINFIDTANIYTEGQSEEITGQAIRNLGVSRDDLVLATKVRGKMGEGPNQAGLTRKHIMEQVEASLRRLNTDYIDLYQTHSYDPLTPFEETLRALDDLVRQGKVRYLGASNVMAWQLMKAVAISERERLARYQSLQAYYTLASRDLEREVLPLLHDQKLGLMVWSPLAGGFLSGKYTRENQKGEGRRSGEFDFPLVDKDRAFTIIDQLRPMAEAKHSTVAALALAWLLHQPAVTTVIIGAKKMDQLEANLQSVDVQFTADELKQLAEVSQLAPEYPGWMVDFTSADRQV